MRKSIAIVWAGVALWTVTGCGTTNATNSAPKQVVVQNGAFSVKHLDVHTGDSVQFKFGGQGKDQFLIVGVTKSPFVSSGNTWTYQFTKTGDYKVEMNDMTYVSMDVTVSP